MTENRIIIDRDLCNGCGLCVSVCPSCTISIKDGKAAFSGSECLLCGHCEAICPQQAVKCIETDEEMSSFVTFSADKKWLHYGNFPVAALVQLMASRRSCRNFSDKPIERSILDDLIKIGITAPSGTNSQCWTFTVLPTRKAVASLSELVASYFMKLNATAEKRWLRLLLRLIGRGELDAYFHSYFRKVQMAIQEWQVSGRDRLFHGSTAAIVIGSKPGASCPAEDALLATQNILLAAHSMGLGSCLIGYAVAAMKRDPSIKRHIGIPDEEEIYSVIALGYPKEIYQRIAGRKKVAKRYFEGSATNKEYE